MKHIRPKNSAVTSSPKKPHAGAGEIRIIGGRYKRSKLTVPVAQGLRPTGDRVRETLFNWLGQDLSGWRCIDAFAGSGALGFEAASRGAKQSRLSMTGIRIASGDAVALLASQRGAQWDLIFLDPPFGDATVELGINKVYEQALKSACDALAGDGLVYLESGLAWSAQTLGPLGFEIYREGKAGAVRFYLLAKTPTVE
jgi:16S rRNA (guanine966-N2)-methyltransferase